MRKKIDNTDEYNRIYDEQYPRNNGFPVFHQRYKRSDVSHRNKRKE
jgi:hypothetical protein